ncbi:MAG: hypothetical protein PHE77_00755 [Candidatus Pacebacteria bacterium]|nr:hypothetical protein [Candidatus Paceibacterota bacterium]
MKLDFRKVIVFCGAVFMFAPFFVFSQENTWVLKQKQAIGILDIIRKNSFPKLQSDWFFESIYYPNSSYSAKAGAVMLVKQSVLQEQLNYWFVEQQIQLSKNLITAIYKLLPLVTYGDFSGAIDLIEKYTVSQANKYIHDWLAQNQVQIGSGIGKYDFQSYKGNWTTINIPYIIVYSPIDATKGKIVVEFYSHKAIEPPINRGSFSCPDGVADWLTSTCWPFDTWLQNPNNKKGVIEPFIVRVKGQMIKDKYGNFFWDKTVEVPSVEVEFGKPVPEISQADVVLKELGTNQSQGFLQDKINQIKQTAQSIIDKAKDFFSFFNSLPQAQISSFINKVTETGSRIDSVEQSQEIAEQAEETKNEQDADHLKEELLKLKSELEQAIKEKQAELDQLLAAGAIATTTLFEAELQATSTTTTTTTTTQHTICQIATEQEPSFNKIIFNEIAWMGTPISANDEWIATQRHVNILLPL